MTCSNCGAEIKKSYPKCRKCGTLNPKLGSGKKRKKSSDNKPFLIIGVILVILSIAVLSLFKINEYKKDEQIKSQLLTLEQSFRNNDYEAVYRYIDSNTVSGEDFNKYLEIHEVYKYKHFAINAVNSLSTCNADSDPTNVKYAIQSVISNCLYGINECNTYINDNTKSGNEDVFNGVIQDFKNMLRSSLNLSSAETDKLCELSDITEAMLMPYVSDIYDRLF